VSIALDQQAVNNSTASTVVVTITATAPGALLLAAISFATASSQTITGVTDSAGNTWTPLTARFQSGVNSYFQFWYSTNAASVTSVTATGSSTSAKGMNVTSWTSTVSPLLFEQEAGTASAASTTITAATATTTHAVTLVAKGANHNGSATGGTLSWTGASAATRPTATATGQSQELAFKLYTSSGQNEATTWTIVSGAWGTATAVFYEPTASTPISSSDSGAVTDAVSGLALSGAQSIALSEATGPIALQTAESAAVSEVTGPIALTQSDTQTQTEVVGQIAPQASDSAGVADVVSGLALAAADSGALGESAFVGQPVSDADAFTLAEQAQVADVTPPAPAPSGGGGDAWEGVGRPYFRGQAVEPVPPRPARERIPIRARAPKPVAFPKAPELVVQNVPMAFRKITASDGARMVEAVDGLALAVHERATLREAVDPIGVTTYQQIAPPVFPPEWALEELEILAML
jgi:hypothetical protein